LESRELKSKKRRIDRTIAEIKNEITSIVILISRGRIPIVQALEFDGDTIEGIKMMWLVEGSDVWGSCSRDPVVR
jgi:hypothetical protein